MNLSIANTSRLKSKKKIDLLFQNGKRLGAGSLHLRYLTIEPTEASLFGFSVPKKIHATAVSRNKIKRLMRECLRAQGSQELQNGSLMMFIYLGKSIPSFDELNKQMNNLLKKLNDETS